MYSTWLELCDSILVSFVTCYLTIVVQFSYSKYFTSSTQNMLITVIKIKKELEIMVGNFSFRSFEECKKCNNITWNCKHFFITEACLNLQPHETVKHTQIIRQQQPTNCLSMFGHFVGLGLEGFRSCQT